MLSIRDFELDSDAGDLQSVASEQRRELMAAQALDSDLDFAFNLQLQEALSASLSLQNLPSSSSAASSAPQLNPTEPKDDVSTFAQIQSDEILKLEQELKDQTISESEFRKLKDDLRRRIHDRKVALYISRISDEEWQDWGDNYERPFGEGSSKGANDEVFKIYFKGLVERQLKNGALLGGIGVAICDSRDDLLFELRKPLIVNGLSRKSAEFMALIEGLNAALALELERVTFYCDYYPTYNFINGRWSAKQKKVMSLVNKVSQLRDKFIYSQPSLVPRNDIKFAFKLAKEAILSQLSKPAESSGSRVLYETCVICLEDKDVSQIFSIDNCMHRYCRSCMKQHVEVKLLHGMLPTCPHEGCKSELKIDSCSKFLTTRLIEIMTQRLTEASIPVTEKVYCPYPKCSALMSKKEVFNYSKSAILRAEISGARKCMKCNGQFCINCKVPWHINMTCFEYKMTNPFPQLEEVRLKNLAASNLWRQCVKCNHMIELAAGCYHMTCRCGYQFCYTCGAEWRNKKATCSCPLWDEENILQEEEEEEEDYEDYEDEDEEYYDSDSDEYI